MRITTCVSLIYSRMREIPERVYRIITRRGFVEEFWNELRLRRAEDPKTTRREVFESLEELYESEFGEEQFPSYDSFRHSKEFREHWNK